MVAAATSKVPLFHDRGIIAVAEEVIDATKRPPGEELVETAPHSQGLHGVRLLSSVEVAGEDDGVPVASLPLKKAEDVVRCCLAAADTTGPHG